MGAVGRALSRVGEGCFRRSSWLLEREEVLEGEMDAFVDGDGEAYIHQVC